MTLFLHFQVIDIEVELTAAHKGHFEFRLCALSETGEETEACFDQNRLQIVDPVQSGTEYHVYDRPSGLFPIQLQLPTGLTCSQCVLQWHYRAGKYFFQVYSFLKKP